MMYDTISQAAQKTGISAHTLRYYDRMGLLPFIGHAPDGSRRFQEDDYEWLSVLQCLKNTGMPLNQIKTYMDWCMEGDSTLEQRLKLFRDQKAKVEKQYEELKKWEGVIDYKIGYIKKRLNGAERSHKSVF